MVFSPPRHRKCRPSDALGRNRSRSHWNNSAAPGPCGTDARTRASLHSEHLRVQLRNRQRYLQLRLHIIEAKVLQLPAYAPHANSHHQGRGGRTMFFLRTSPMIIAVAKTTPCLLALPLARFQAYICLLYTSPSPRD